MGISLEMVSVGIANWLGIYLSWRKLLVKHSIILLIHNFLMNRSKNILDYTHLLLQ